MTPADPAPFDVCGPLPEPGVTLLEASAGTGKTYTIAALVARFVAEGTPLSQILAVTFTRLATGELRDRVRERLVSVHAALDRFLRLAAGDPAAGDPAAGDPAAGDPAAGDPAAGDPVAQLLTRGGHDMVAERRRRLAQALASFDEATITTTHGFCQLMLASMGVMGGASAGSSLLEDTSELLGQVVGDIYLRWCLRGGTPEFSLRAASAVARAVVQNPGTTLVPERGESVPGLLRCLGDDVREELARRLKEAELLTFDDLLCRLRDCLADPAACDRLAGQFSVVLVDEFQDTDPVQWEIVKRAFGQGRTVLVLIGDPKQAIYAFRGADVYAYLEASAVAGSHRTLGENHRADAGLLQALDALLDPTLLGHPEIPYRRVRATGAHRLPGLAGAPSPAALRFRVVGDHQPGIPQTLQKLLQKPATTRWVAHDLAADVAALLGSGAELVTWRPDGTESSRRPLVASDVAVLVRTNRQAAQVHEALRGAGVPSVVAASASIFATEAARNWLELLQALEQPASAACRAAVALGPFVGMSPAQLASATDAELEQLTFRLHRFGEVLRRRGVASLYRLALAEGGVPGRLLRQAGGERQLTDLGHVAEVLGTEAAISRLGPSQLRAWLARRMAEAADDQSEEATQRLDTDAQAVHVLTIHRAKGLEFPVVYCPYLWDGAQAPRNSDPVVFHDPDAGDRRTLDVGTGGADTAASPNYEAHRKLCLSEERGEELRQLYVALTRAKQQVVLWWARATDCQRSALGRLLFSRGPDGEVEAEPKRRAPKHTEVMERLQRLAARAGKNLAVEHAGDHTGGLLGVTGEQAADPDSLVAASFTRQVDQLWRRSSYSAITAAAHEDLVGSEPEQLGTVDEPAGAPGEDRVVAVAGVAAGTVVGAAAGAVAGGAAVSAAGAAGAGLAAGDPLAAACPLDVMPAGATVGTVVHRVLEQVDFAAADLESALSEALRGAQARHGAVLGPPEPVVAGLAAALRTPLGPLCGGARLCDLARRERLDELSFEFPVAGGDGDGAGAGPGTGAVVGIDALATVLARHEDAGGPLAGYAARLSDPALERSVRGYLTGSIDLVFRRALGGEMRYFVVDYKTNRLAPPGEALQAWHYRPEALSAEMQRLHYPLQGLIYSVALHRYLRWRLDGYDPDRHFGGVLYLFLRGMLGPHTPRLGEELCGVFSWRPAPGLLREVSDLFDTGSSVYAVRAS